MRSSCLAALLAVLAGCASRGPAGPEATGLPSRLTAVAAPADSPSPPGGLPEDTTGRTDQLAPRAAVAASTASDPATPPPPPPLAARWLQVSVPGQAAASSGPAGFAVDGDRTTEWNPRTAIAPGAPQWLALPLRAPASDTLAVLWHGHAMHYENYDYGRPRTYQIQASTDSTNGTDGGWTTVETVTDNLVRSRVDLVNAPGARWVRLSFQTEWGGTLQMEPFLREVSVYEKQGPGAPDVWTVYGDSTTAVGLDPSQPEVFDTAVAARHPGYAPMLIPAGTGGDVSGDAITRMGVGLPTVPRGSVVGLCYGTNDAKQAVAIADYKAHLQSAIDLVRAAGDVPLLAVLPWSLNGAIADYAQACRDVAAANALPPGPDFYTYFKDHPDELEVDKVHPNVTGIQSMQRLWAAAGDFRYPSP